MKADMRELGEGNGARSGPDVSFGLGYFIFHVRSDCTVLYRGAYSYDSQWKMTWEPLRGPMAK